MSRVLSILIAREEVLLEIIECEKVCLGQDFAGDQSEKLSREFFKFVIHEVSNSSFSETRTLSGILTFRCSETIQGSCFRVAGI